MSNPTLQLIDHANISGTMYAACWPITFSPGDAPTIQSLTEVSLGRFEATSPLSSAYVSYFKQIGGSPNITNDIGRGSEYIGPVTLTTAYDLAKTPAQSGDAMTLISAYNAAKTAASQTSVDAVKTQTDKIGSTGADSANITSIKAKTDLIATNSADSPNQITLQTTVATNLDAKISQTAKVGDAMTLTSAYDASKTASQAGDAMSLTTNERNSVADAILKRDFTTVSGVAPRRSLWSALRFIVNKWSTTANTGSLTVYQEDDITEAYRKSISTTSGADPITGG